MSETIAAIATAYGEGGIGIIRISGDDAFIVLKKIFVSRTGNEIENRRMAYGNIIDPNSGRIVDEVLAVYTKAPKTYTCEDVVEINCHGSIVAQRRILELVLSNGARIAEPGEFTKRAFLNGRLDLSQAEAVIDLVKAKGDKTFDVALNQLEGDYSKAIKDIRSEIMDSLVDITVNIDYPDEDIEELTYSKLLSALETVKIDIDKLLSTSETGRIVKEGLRVSIIGKPNVGKSSLMNSLLQETRAIVTDIAGTTRDTIEETISINGICVLLTDTAGIHDTDNPIEKIGIEKSKESFNNADLVIFVVDSSSPLDQEDLEIMNYLGNRKSVVMLNKTDLPQKTSKEELLQLLPEADIIETSLLQGYKGKGLDLIKKTISDLVYDGEVKQQESLIITNARHKALLEGGRKSISDAIEMTTKNEALEFIEIDVNSAYAQLGEIIGEEVAEDIINEVFSRFCLGK